MAVAQEGIVNVPEQAGILGAEEPVADLLDGPTQFGVLLVVLPGIIVRRERVTCAAVRPKIKMLSSPTYWRISMVAPSMVPMVRAPLSANFMLPVPEASVPASRPRVSFCCCRSPGMTGFHASARPLLPLSTTKLLRVETWPSRTLTLSST